MSVSDPTGTLARPIRALRTTGLDGDALQLSADEVSRLAAEEPLDAIVVGFPRRLDGSPNEMTPRIERFAARLRERTGLPVILLALAALPGSILIARFGALRTLMTGLLLTALGACEEDIIADYFLSNEDESGYYRDILQSYETDSQREMMKKVFFVLPEYLDIFMGNVNTIYGGVMGYLSDRIGITPSEIDKLRELYTQ